MAEIGERAGNNVSFWERTAKKFQSAPVAENLTTDVCIVGGGIAGVTTAYLLARERRNVVLIDDGPLGSGMTGRTTAHLSNMIDDGYVEIEEMLGEEYARLIAESHSAATDRIEEIVLENKIECDFERLEGYLFLPPGGSVTDLMKELDAIHRAGLTDVERVDEVPKTKIKTDAALRFSQQAQFHPLKYLEGVARAIVDLGGRIFTGTRVVSVKDGDRVTIQTSDGNTITAQAAVVATNSPINDRLVIHSKQAPYASYVIALRVKEKTEHVLYWDTAETAAEEKQTIAPAPYHYVRFARDGDNDVLIVGGQDHKTGQADDCEMRFSKLERWARDRFPFAGEITDRWSGQVLEPVDGAAYIGRNPGDKNVYVATGFSGNGITYGTISGMLIVDLIAGRENRWAKLYDPARITLEPKALADYVRENANVAAQMIDYVTAGDEPSADKIKNGDGAILREGARKIAAYRDENGTLHQFSAVCPHLKCIVRWDSCEKTWDCPCHGSRFDALGRVVNGPAISDLERVE
ncbi:MAG TPA: FAD-dependent oxidoreductase [Chthoniobacterales bacterium]|jgi:glycine/D-amino acid oxidase-like deaminating enzyme/nitrite reductase/ring-hydroxylating ferredoxin subunit|nr:FAD-dependent oxidoreductase [Chthoniobacterales bacterium]